MLKEQARTGGSRPAVGEILVAAVKGIRSEILLYGIVVMAIIVCSAQFGIAILRELEAPLLLFATIVLAVYVLLALLGARKRVHAVKSDEAPPR